MKKQYLTAGVLLALFFLSGCEDDKKKFFEEERYEKMMYIVSDDKNIHDLVYDLDGQDNNIRNISIACSGTNPITIPGTIVIEPDSVLLPKYNYINFVEDSSQFAHQLPESMFSMESKSVVYPVGAQNILVPIKIAMPVLESLSPDSTYFIPVAIADASPYGIVTEKRNALMRIQRKNKYGNTAQPVNYNATGYEGAGYFVITKVVTPLKKNQVRMFIGTKRLPSNVSAQYDFIVKNSVIIEVAEDNTLTIKPYAPNSMQVETLDKDQLHPEDGAYGLYSNRYDPQTSSFFVYYRYKTTGGWTEMREAVRLPVISVK